MSESVMSVDSSDHCRSDSKDVGLRTSNRRRKNQKRGGREGYQHIQIEEHNLSK